MKKRNKEPSTDTTKENRALMLGYSNVTEKCDSSKINSIFRARDQTNDTQTAGKV